MKWQVPVLLILVLAGVPIISAWDQSFPWAGTYTICHVGASCGGAGHEVIPSNVTYLSMNIAGAGGSGKSTGNNFGWNLWGYGGSAGQHGYYTLLPVVNGTTYTLIVGTGGAQSAAYTASNAGTASSAFGITMAGGAGGLQGGAGPANGGAGESSNFILAAPPASSGGNSDVYTGGVGGTGYGSGGGGAASNVSSTAAGSTYGGAGMDGFIHVYGMNGSAINVPHYTANPLNTGLGTIITFTDESELYDGDSLAYLWDFGDGTTSTTLGTTSHVYSSYGVFSTSLRITSALGTAYENKSSYITITNTPITAWYTQKLVRLKAVDAYGNELENANITVSYISNTLPSKDVTWLTTAFGISQTVATQMVNGGVAMQGYTGNDGSTTFTMFPAIQYGIEITNLSIGLSKYVTIYPQDNDYVIYCPLSTQQVPTSKLTELVNSSIIVTQINATHLSFDMVYQDYGGKTTNMVFNLTNVTTGVQLEYHNHGVNLGDTTLHTWSYIYPATPLGTEYLARIDATRSNGVHDYIAVSVITKDSYGRLIPLGIETFVSATQAAYLYNLISICIILVIAAMSGPRSETAFTILVPLFAGIFMAFGWMRLATPSQTTGLFYVVVMMGVLGVLLYMNEQDKSTSGYSAPGKKIFKLATFLALFTAGLTVMSGFSVLSLVAAQPIPGTCTPGLSCDTYGNFDYTASSSAFSGSNQLDVGSAPGWIAENGINMAIVMINLIVGIFAFPLVLNSVLNGIAPGITAYPAYILFLGFLELAVMFIYIYGAYEFLRGAPAGSTL